MKIGEEKEQTRDKQVANDEINMSGEIMVEERREAGKLEDGGQNKGGWERCQSVRQLFIRGDNVILISSAS